MIDDDDRRWRKRDFRSFDRLADAGGDDARDRIGAREAGGEGEAKRRGRSLEFLKVLAERRADGTLRAYEKRNKNKVAFPGGKLSGHPGKQGPRRSVAVERGEGDAVTVFPRNRVNVNAHRGGQLAGDGAKVKGRGGLEGAVVDENDSHGDGNGFNRPR